MPRSNRVSESNLFINASIIVLAPLTPFSSPYVSFMRYIAVNAILFFFYVDAMSDCKGAGGCKVSDLSMR